MAFRACVIATAFLSLVPLEQSQAQLYIDIYQSRDNTNQTLWVFSGSGTARQLYSVRNNNAANANYHRRDVWHVADNGGDLYAGTEPIGQLVALSSITNQNAISSRDRWYVANVLTNLSTATTPTISFTTSSNPSRSRTINTIYMNRSPGGTGTTAGLDRIGIRVSGGAFTYQNNDASAWSGAGLLNKPFSEFETGSTDGTFTFDNWANLQNSGPAFAQRTQGSVQLRFHRGTIIPEPQEYALLFGLFALGFVFFHRRIMQKKRQASGR